MASDFDQVDTPWYTSLSAKLFTHRQMPFLLYALHKEVFTASSTGSTSVRVALVSPALIV